MAADPEPHNSPAKPESALIMPAKPESALARPAKPESPARMATTPADAPLWPGLITSVLDPPLVSVWVAGIPRSAPSQELAESAPEPAPSQELAESAPEPVPSQELAESAPEPAPSQELAESAPQPVPPSSPSSPLVPPSSPSSPLVPPSSPSPRVLSSLALSSPPPRPSNSRMPLDVRASRVPPWGSGVPQKLSGGELPAIAHWDPEPAMAHGVPWFILAAEALDLPWPPKLPASVLETICALSASCVSVSSRSQSLPGVSSAPP